MKTFKEIISESFDTKYRHRRVLDDVTRKTFVFKDGNQNIVVWFGTDGDSKNIATKQSRTWEVRISGMTKSHKSGAKLKQFNDPMRVVGTIIDILKLFRSEVHPRGFVISIKNDNKIENLIRLFSRIANRELRMLTEVARVYKNDEVLKSPVMFVYDSIFNFNDVYAHVVKDRQRVTQDDIKHKVVYTLLNRKHVKEVVIKPEMVTTTDTERAKEIIQKWIIDNPPKDVKDTTSIDIPKVGEGPRHTQVMKKMVELQSDLFNSVPESDYDGIKLTIEQCDRTTEMFTSQPSNMNMLEYGGILGQHLESLNNIIDKSTLDEFGKLMARDSAAEMIKQYIDIVDDSFTGSYLNLDTGISKLSPKEQRVVRDFTGDGFRQVNDNLSKEANGFAQRGDLNIDRVIGHLDNAFASVGVLGQNIKPYTMLFRGMKDITLGMVRDIVNTKTYTTTSFMSTTMKLSAVKAFTSNADVRRSIILRKTDGYKYMLSDTEEYTDERKVNVVMVIEPENLQLLVPNGYSEFRHECEFIVNRGTVFDVDVIQTYAHNDHRNKNHAGTIVLYLKVRKSINESEEVVTLSEKIKEKKHIDNIIGTLGLFEYLSTYDNGDDLTDEEKEHIEAKFNSPLV